MFNFFFYHNKNIYNTINLYTLITNLYFHNYVLQSNYIYLGIVSSSQHIPLYVEKKRLYLAHNYVLKIDTIPLYDYMLKRDYTIYLIVYYLYLIQEITVNIR